MHGDGIRYKNAKKIINFLDIFYVQLARYQIRLNI